MAWFVPKAIPCRRTKRRMIAIVPPSSIIAVGNAGPSLTLTLAQPEAESPKHGSF
jgi:hypothetical protein